jgi:hypothetical protein
MMQFFKSFNGKAWHRLREKDVLLSIALCGYREMDPQIMATEPEECRPLCTKCLRIAMSKRYSSHSFKE